MSMRYRHLAHAAPLIAAACLAPLTAVSQTKPSPVKDAPAQMRVRAEKLETRATVLSAVPSAGHVVLTADGKLTTLETYEVVIRSNRGKPPTTDYLAVNVVSLVEAADMDASETVEIGRRLRFESLVIDQQKAAGHKLFRLAESSGLLLVDQSVVDHLKAVGGFGLTFLDPEEFSG